MNACYQCSSLLKINTKDKIFAYFGLKIACQNCGANNVYNWKKELLSIAGFSFVMLAIFSITKANLHSYSLSILLFLAFISGSFFLLYKASRLNTYVELTRKI